MAQYKVTTSYANSTVVDNVTYAASGSDGLFYFQDENKGILAAFTIASLVSVVKVQ